MTSRTLTALPLLALFVAVFFTVAAHAQVYKWVDERGVTNYSDGPPADPKARKSVSTVEDKTSVYTPDKAVTQAIEARQQQRNDPLAEKVTSLERQLEAERRARLEAAAIEARKPETPPTEIVSGYYPYPPAVVIVQPRNRPRNIPQIQLPPGTTAGNVVGPTGYIPGNSAAAARSAPPPRTRRVEPEVTRDGSRRNY